MLIFNGQSLIARLWRLPLPLRYIFAVMCAERQMPAYELFEAVNAAGSLPVFRQALDDIWATPDRNDTSALQQQLDECMALIPDEATVQPWTEQATYAQNAAMSVAYAIRARISGEAQEAVWSAQVACESLDHFIVNREDIDIALQSGEVRVLAHPLMQAELLRQHRDLDELFDVASIYDQQTIMRFRERAKAESKMFFNHEVIEPR